MRRLLIICLISFNAAGQSNDELVQVNVPKVNAQFGQDVLLRILVSVKNGYHIQSHEVKDALIIPTTLEFDGDKIFTTGNQAFPPAKEFMLNGTEQHLEVYDGDFEIQASLGMSEGIQKGVHQLKGKLKYQACDSMRCLFPRTVEFPVNIEIQ